MFKFERFDKRVVDYAIGAINRVFNITLTETFKGMKYIYLALAICLFSCNTTLPEKEISKMWLGKPVNFNRIQETVYNYHMFDSTGAEVGSMAFGWSFEDGMLVSRDTSQFYDGSVYETAIFEFDTSDFRLSSLAIDMKMGPTTLDIDLSYENDKIQGMAKMSRDTLIREFPVDSVFGQHVFREELYMLMHTLDYKEGDSLALDVFVPSGLGMSKASITYVGQESIQVPAGKFDCTVILLQSSGGMPTNKIWISNEEPAKMVKFYVPGAELTIELADL